MSTTKHRDGGKEQFWRRIVRQWGKSGQSVSAFCRQRGLSEASFYAWRRTLARRDAQTVQFVPLRVAPRSLTPEQATAPSKTPAAGDGSSADLELVLNGGRRLRIGPVFDEATQRRLLTLLEEGQP